MAAARRVRGCSLTVAFTPPHAGDVTRAWLGAGATYEPQVAGDLGARMAAALGARLAAGAERVIVIGTDCPEADEFVIEQAFSALDETDIVLGPAADGGYYLIGMRRLHDELFVGIPWSSDETLQRSLDHAVSSGLRVHLLPELADVDTAADWRRWQQRRGEDQPKIAGPVSGPANQ
jgi:rSAM/selenodomain-associated transferase 1